MRRSYFLRSSPVPSDVVRHRRSRIDAVEKTMNALQAGLSLPTILPITAKQIGETTLMPIVCSVSMIRSPHDED